MEYDLLRHGRHVDDLGTEALSWRDLKVIIHEQRSSESAVHRAIYPDEYDRDKKLDRLEHIAVLLIQGHLLAGNQTGAKWEDLPKSWDDLFTKPVERVEITLLSLDEIDRRMGWAT